MGLWHVIQRALLRCSLLSPNECVALVRLEQDSSILSKHHDGGLNGFSDKNSILNHSICHSQETEEHSKEELMPSGSNLLPFCPD